jgi:hypothetical protein
MGFQKILKSKTFFNRFIHNNILTVLLFTTVILREIKNLEIKTRVIVNYPLLDIIHLI